MVVRQPRRRGQGRDIRAGLDLAERESCDGGAGGDAWQIAFLELIRTGKGNGTAAEALHRESEIGEPAMPRQGFAGDHQITRLQRVMGAAMGRGNAILEPAGGAERAHPAPTGRVNIVAMSDIGSRIGSPFVDLVCESTMFRVKERQTQMRGPAHDGSPSVASALRALGAELSVIGYAGLPAITIPAANHCIFCRPRQTGW